MTETNRNKLCFVSTTLFYFCFISVLRTYETTLWNKFKMSGVHLPITVLNEWMTVVLYCGTCGHTSSANKTVFWLRYALLHVNHANNEILTFVRQTSQNEILSRPSPNSRKQFLHSYVASAPQIAHSRIPRRTRQQWAFVGQFHDRKTQSLKEENKTTLQCSEWHATTTTTIIILWPS